MGLTKSLTHQYISGDIVTSATNAIEFPGKAESFDVPSECALSDIVTERIKQALRSEGDVAPACTPGPGLAAWANREHSAFRLRVGPAYMRLRRKSVSEPALYTCVGVEVVQATCQIKSALASLHATSWDAFVTGIGKGSTRGQTSPGPLPRVIVVNFQVPFQVGPAYGAHPASDHGCSVLLFLRLAPEAAAAAAAAAAVDTDLSTAPPAIRLLAHYLRKDAHPKAEGSSVTGCLKCVGLLDNVEDLDIPSAALPVVRCFNGKPVLVERETRMYGLGSGWPLRPSALADDVVELAVDIRGFNPLARVSLSRLRGLLRSAALSVGLLIQGCADEELPERLFGAVSFTDLHLLGARKVTVPSEWIAAQGDSVCRSRQGSIGLHAACGGTPVSRRRCCVCRRRMATLIRPPPTGDAAAAPGAAPGVRRWPVPAER